ncbi:peptidylprolyl isomerase [Subtercola boreus]|uniref:peptidylprolyl isomerase n=1 Tax=Subtercola boreus TaxID=120213 RepID=A0A3E0WBC3_9MICO|nr:peptidylprolyl isomerase [Subtercola boreus]RFA21319.1 peptidylprolyl isomerase [Subtercola boreus]RFA21702.1 peptidylprolyl isomerase [Subtercola boreus]RFA27671.1 peptidylprolyl isomerase [Subtercola boreus]
MAPSNSEREAREAKQRLRNYQARQSVHASQVSRRRRDNLLAVIALLVVIVLAVLAQLFYFSGGPGMPAPTPSTSATPEPTATPTTTPSATGNTGDVPPTTVAQGRDWTGTLTLNSIPLAITLDGVAAPQAVSSFISLVQAGFYTNLTCHRLTTEGIFVLQCGDPNGDGTGGPGYSYGPVENAPAGGVYPAGTLAMARQGDAAYSQGSQFFIVYADSTIPADTAGGYTVLGQVTSGLDQLQSGVIAAGVASGTQTPNVPTTITSVTVQ